MALREKSKEKGKEKGKLKGRGRSRPKVCRFCEDKTMVADYRDPELLRRFLTEHGKILPRRVTGTCAHHQRLLARQIKRARVVALVP